MGHDTRSSGFQNQSGNALFRGGGGGGGSGFGNKSGNALFRSSKQSGGGGGKDAGANAVLGMLALVGGPIGIIAAGIGFAIGAFAGLKAKKEEEVRARERMSRVTKQMVQANTDAAFEQDVIGREETTVTGQARNFSETEENAALDLRMAEDIAAEGARQTYAVAKTNERIQEALQLTKEDISKDLRSQPMPIMTAVQGMLDLGSAANALGGALTNAAGAANQQGRQADADAATARINASVAEGGKLQVSTQELIGSMQKARGRQIGDDVAKLGGNAFGFNFSDITR